jgi:hypothetical protein
MKVKDLLEQLKDLDPELDLYLQIDQEGNGYEEVRGVDPDNVMVGDSMYSTDWSADDACMDEDEWEELKNGPKCAVIFP